jgi:hypothetical protein
MDRILDVADVDWSRGFVRWRAVVVFIAMMFFPVQTLGVVTSWEQHKLDGIVTKIERVDQLPAPYVTAPSEGRDRLHVHKTETRPAR